MSSFQMVHHVVFREMLHCFIRPGWIALHMHEIAVNPLYSFLIKHMHIPPPLKTIPSVSVTYTSLDISGYPSVGVLHVQHLLSKNWFKAILENVNNTLRLRCIPSALKHEYCVRGWGGWRGLGVTWEGTEPVIMDKHLAPFPPERLQWPRPNHCLLRHWSLLAHTPKSTISPLPVCLPASPTLVCP